MGISKNFLGRILVAYGTGVRRRMKICGWRNWISGKLVADLSLTMRCSRRYSKVLRPAQKRQAVHFLGGLPYQRSPGMRTADAEPNRLPLAESA
jgi:putative transposase